MRTFVPVLIFFFCGICNESYSRKYYIQTSQELAGLQLEPGDTVILREGSWIDQRLELNGNGTESMPIVFMAEVPGKVKLTGNSTLAIAGTWLIVNGLCFLNGNAGEEDIINFQNNSSWCRLTNTAVVDYNPKEKTTNSGYVSMHGAHNRVDHCFFKGKTNHGPTLIIWLSETPNFHQVDHNHFGHRPALGENGGETIRVGTSTWSLHDSFTLIEYNLFEHCDGEAEIISNKSGHNTIRFNTFFESDGTLTLRHGNDAVVYGNYFIGNNKKNTGGIRIIGEHHVVFGNYFKDLRGTGIRAAISIMNGIPDSPLNGYYQVKNSQVINNIIINCEESFSFGTGKNESRTLPPVNCFVSSNHVVPGRALITWEDESSEIKLENNTLYGKYDHTIPPGFKPQRRKTLKQQLEALNLQQQGEKPLTLERTGISWLLK